MIRPTIRSSSKAVSQSTQLVERTVGVGGWLEVGQKHLRLIAPSQAIDAAFDLGGNRVASHPTTRTKRTIVTEGTTPFGDRAIDIGAGKTAIQADFLHVAHRIFGSNIRSASSICVPAPATSMSTARFGLFRRLGEAWSKTVRVGH